MGVQKWNIVPKGVKIIKKSIINNQLPCKHTPCIPRSNDVETTVSTSFWREIDVVCLWCKIYQLLNLLSQTHRET